MKVEKLSRKLKGRFLTLKNRRARLSPEFRQKSSRNSERKQSHELFDRTVVVYPNLTNKRFYYILTMADTDRTKFDGPIAALRGFLDCYEGSEERGMVCADGVYEKGAINGTKFIAAAKKLGKSVR